MTPLPSVKLLIDTTSPSSLLIVTSWPMLVSPYAIGCCVFVQSKGSTSGLTWKDGWQNTMVGYGKKSPGLPVIFLSIVAAPPVRSHICHSLRREG